MGNDRLTGENFQGPDADLVRKWLDFGQNVRELRRARGWTQKDLATALQPWGVELTQSTIAKLEGGTRPTVVHEIWALARVFGVGYELLLPSIPADGGEDWRELRLAYDAKAAAREDLQRLRSRYEEAQARVDVADRHVEELEAKHRITSDTTLADGRTSKARSRSRHPSRG